MSLPVPVQPSAVPVANTCEQYLDWSSVTVGQLVAGRAANRTPRGLAGEMPATQMRDTACG